MVNPYFVPMLLVVLAQLTSTHPQKFTHLVIENKKLPMSMRLAWCANLLPTYEMRQAIDTLFEQCTSLDRLQFVGLGRHPDALMVLTEYIYSTRDCQIVSHILVAGHCFEDLSSIEQKNSSESNNLSVEEPKAREMHSSSAPSLYEMFSACYLARPGDMRNLLHFLRAEFCRYAALLQRMQRYCFRRKLLNLVPQIYWPEFKTLANISCIFCGYNYKVASRSGETGVVSEHLVQMRSRSTVGRGAASRSSASITGPSTTPAASMAIPVESESNGTNNNAVLESLSDYNGVDGGTEAEIKRPPDSACPQCRKPYPRCSLCGYSFLTPVNDYDHEAGVFSMMFATCLMCSHGGHMKHLISWFEKENVCPVLGCDCRCITLENARSHIKKRIMKSQ
ncbi:hypothetical protein OESDEN_02021 [Oesophagostomum dentatum]|uniref:GATOR2 complex protein MIO zinc-ribbon like domain-containing protein n=1 Tax=Oesophagostomum dentatum TaxID=61180 RepID=A0A0B1TRG3_OESDE|nr:hypothetical protein OESDEN_02021 [Oesophagostomum dentatum]